MLYQNFGENLWLHPHRTFILKMKATCSVNTSSNCLPHYTASDTRRHVLHTHGRNSLESHKKQILFASLILSRI